jgi:hypothetical protein
MIYAGGVGRVRSSGNKRSNAKNKEVNDNGMSPRGSLARRALGKAMLFILVQRIQQLRVTQ